MTAFIRLLFFKRTPEPAHRTQAEELSKKITKILIGHCEYGQTVEGPVGVCYNTIALGACLLQVFDDRGPEGHLHMVLFIVFQRMGGLDRLLELVTLLLDNADQEGLEGADKVRAAGGITVALETLSALVRPKAIISNPQSLVLQQRTEMKTSPTDMFIRIRLQIFPYAKRVWESAWLQHAPVKVAQKGIKAFLTIMEGKDEKEKPHPAMPVPPRMYGMVPVAQPVVPVVRAPLTADAAGVDQLVDMGFARGSAEQAMIRGRNNVAAATEMLLSMPHVFENAAAAAPPAPAPPAEPVVTQEALVLEEDVAGPSETTATTETAPATTADESMEIDKSPTPPPSESAEEVKKALDELREQAKPDLATRALALLSGEDALMFDLIPAFPNDESALTLLLKSFSVDDAENLIANKLRLFSILSVAHEIPELNEENATLAYSVIKSLPIETKPRPNWLTSLLCFAETVMVLSINVKTVEIGAEPESITEIARIEEQDRLLSACRGILADEATQAEMVTAYRCMVVISKYNNTIDFADCLAPFKAKLDQRLSTCHQLLAMILRHGFEDRATLDEVMQSEVRTWFNRDKVTEVGHFVKQLRQATSRHSDSFVDAIEKECALVDPKPVAGVYHIRAKATEKKAVTSDPFSASGTVSHPTMELLVKELGTATKATLNEEATSEGYACLIFSLITEVVGSYNSAKKSFVEALRATGLNGPKSRNEISPIVSDLVGCVELGRDLASDGQKGVKPTRRMIISGWATSMLVALCSDITTGSDAKVVSEDLTSIRKTVLDAIIKVLKDSSTQDANVRYGKLWAMGELVYRLLTAKSAIAPRHDDSSLLLAKAMVEKNFVGLITDAMGGVDLNFPNIKVPLMSLLKALDHL
jgi:E3 ubiquitin-protein ligase HUWE1